MVKQKSDDEKIRFATFRDFYLKTQIEMEQTLADLHRKIINQTEVPISARSVMISEFAVIRKKIARLFRDVFIRFKKSFFKSSPPLPYHLNQAISSPVNWTFKKDKAKCEICGETRSVDIAHIIPRSRGGSGSVGNLFFLCPTHHSLFDRHQLSRDEWSKLDFSKKLEATREYAKVILLRLEKWWSDDHKF